MKLKKKPGPWFLCPQLTPLFCFGTMAYRKLNYLELSKCLL